MRTRLLAVLVAGIGFSLGAAAADRGGYLFVTFRGEATPRTEQIYFMVSESGRDWEALNGGQPVLLSTVGEEGVRDPFILRSPDNTHFYLIATDLSIHLNGDWGDLCEDDKEENAFSLKHGYRLLSAYNTPHGQLWIITEADRSATTFLLPEEY